MYVKFQAKSEQKIPSFSQVSDSQQEKDNFDDNIIPLEPQPGTSVDHDPSTNQESSCTTKAIPVRCYEGCPTRKRRKVANTGEDAIKTVTSALK
ncbi:hypothetical protein AVEN_170154-1 [Araneus ventricosus]|uniref:Uncharacterized protein n=1 Tax=Araneus ventricosus TaxID=182803 RepID=A0A4Y2NPH4_ARAVE|nr:hypothetical protein AVEN_170154-1 [Araneus ventricosus]